MLRGSILLRLVKGFKASVLGQLILGLEHILIALQASRIWICPVCNAACLACVT